MQGSRKTNVLYGVTKRAFDVCFASVALVVLAVPGTLLCVAISVESPGNPLFRQNRIGRNGRVIRIFKFRSMFADAHDHPDNYLDDGQLAQWRREQKVDDDPRVTKIGRFIRRTSIDETPQFINVLLGDMSIVGPRPVTLSETFEYGDDRDEVLSVRPGITGWWQVTDRNDATWENGRRQELELWYVRNASLLTDIKVIVKTFGTIAKATGM